MPSYTLNYFNGRGRAELTRLVFAAAGTEFTDNRVEFGTGWPGTLKEQSPLGQLPFLESEGVKLPQSIAIARFAARETGLDGKTSLEKAQADAIVDTVMDLVNFYYANVFKVQDPEEKKKALDSFLADQGLKGASNVETLISMYGKNGFSVGDSLTWADLVVFDTCVALFDKFPEFKSKYSKLSEVYDSVSANANVAAYVKSRPETPF